MINFSNIEELNPKHADDDLFICALGFEDRCVFAPKLLSRSNYHSSNIFLMKYDAHESENYSNYENLLNYLQTISKNEIIELNYFLTDIDKSEKIFFDTLNLNHIQPKKISIDITSMCSSEIIHILSILKKISSVEIVRIIYTEAEIYFPLKNEKRTMTDDIYLSSGIKEVVVIPDFIGDVYPGYSALLVIFLGFDPIRARGAINFFQPSHKIGILGIPPDTDKSWRIEEVLNRNSKLFDKDDEIEEISTFYFKDTIERLSSIYKNFSSNSNIAICPLGSKLQTIGVFLFAIEHLDVKLIFPIPMEFHPKRYSKGARKSWELTLVFKKRIDN